MNKQEMIEALEQARKDVANGVLSITDGIPVIVELQKSLINELERELAEELARKAS